MPPLAVEGAWKGRELIKIHQKSVKTRHFYHFFSTSLDSSVGWAVDSSARGPGFKSRREQDIKFCWNIAFFDQKKGVYERDFALASLRIPLRVPKLYLGWYWSSNCDVQSSSCARVRTRKEKVKMTKSWKILNIFLKKRSLDMGPITKVVAYAKKPLEIRGFLEMEGMGWTNGI